MHVLGKSKRATCLGHIIIQSQLVFLGLLQLLGRRLHLLTCIFSSNVHVNAHADVSKKSQQDTSTLNTPQYLRSNTSTGHDWCRWRITECKEVLVGVEALHRWHFQQFNDQKKRNCKTLSTPRLLEPCVQDSDLKSAWTTLNALARDLPRLRNGGCNNKQAYSVCGNWTASELETRGPCSDCRRAECSLRLARARYAPYTLHTLRASRAKYKLLIACVCSRDPYPKEGLYSFVARTRVSLLLRLSLATCLSFLPRRLLGKKVTASFQSAGDLLLVIDGVNVEGKKPMEVSHMIGKLPCPIQKFRRNVSQF